MVTLIQWGQIVVAIAVATFFTPTFLQNVFFVYILKALGKVGVPLFSFNTLT